MLILIPFALVFATLVVLGQEEVHPLHSHVVCTSNDPGERVCRVKNLFFHIEAGQWGIQSHSRQSIKSRCQSDGRRLLDVTSLQNHNKLFFSMQEFKAIQSENIVETFKGTTHLFRRFLPNNIMHVLHDDWLGGWFIQHKLWPAIVKRTVFIDRYPKNTTYDELYSSLAPASHMSDIIQGRRIGYILFEDVIVGNSKEHIWYQYGFKRPQSPLFRPVDRRMLIEAADHFLGTAREDSENQVLIFSRSRNRLIVNEQELVQAIERETKQTCRIVRLEDYNGRLRELLRMVSESKGIVGMHGSMLAIGLWLPADAIIVELFPYAVPARNYTPYKTMAEIMGIKYVAWENKNANRSIAFPDRSVNMGGLRHLSPEQAEMIKQETEIKPHRCCKDPSWLYRIYQDTYVDVAEIVQILLNHI